MKIITKRIPKIYNLDEEYITISEWHDVSSVCYKILEISDSRYKVIKSLIISKCSLDFKEVEKEYTDEYGIEQIEGSLLIDEAQYAKAIVAAKDVRDKVIEKNKKTSVDCNS